MARNIRSRMSRENRFKSFSAEWERSTDQLIPDCAPRSRLSAPQFSLASLHFPGFGGRQRIIGFNRLPRLHQEATPMLGDLHNIAGDETQRVEYGLRNHDLAVLANSTDRSSRLDHDG
ncbi:MAG TPA: hypothetical protein VJV74_02960 [Terriglobia bacterium]|nr:hypothetical protein [Terriglobia bacterium]